MQGARLGALVVTTEEVGQDGDAVEAYIFAYLAARYFDGLPITFPPTTGADYRALAASYSCRLGPKAIRLNNFVHSEISFLQAGASK
jgi:hypothetical protein